jgi:hypothetical protein
MNGKAILVIAIVIVSLSVTTTANSPFFTPLYTVRMEQQSSEMNFLPSAMNGFTYNAEKGCTLHQATANYCSTHLRGTFDTCGECTTIEITCYTCWNTCLNTCENTCWSTCPNTCPNTCWDTCPNTCENTCQDTCWNTCWNTCEYTCEGPECTTIEITCYTCYAC